jgi:leucyl aminopeptidase
MQFSAVKSTDNPSIVVLGFPKGAVDFELIQSYTGSSSQPDFQGNFKQIMSLYHASEPRKVYLVGLGEAKDKAKAHDAFRWLAHKRKKNWGSAIYIDCRHLDAAYTESAVLGTTLATYDIGTYKTDEEELPAFYDDDFLCTIISGDDVTGIVQRGEATAESMMQIMALVDAPGNVKTPTFLAEWAQSSAQTYGYEFDALEYEELVEEGLEALLAVGQGSAHPPVLIKVEYKPYGLTNAPKIGLVGKGITFDTGGLSIKPSNNMHYMKSDMGGAAAVLGAVELAAKLKLPVHLVGLVASAENAVDANSVKPGDVIGSYSGKTIEVIDTDAEGRLVLADALSYMVRNYAPDYMIDLATLTGSSVMTLGYSAGAMFTHDDDLATLVSVCGEAKHERVWRLPLYDDFKADIHSDIADVRNYSGKPLAGAITAAKFLEAFVEEHKHWMHLDIAGVAFGDSPYSKMKSASGYGVRLLHEVINRLTEKK